MNVKTPFFSQISFLGVYTRHENRGLLEGLRMGMDVASGRPSHIIGGLGT
jgi:hypothetical protein